MFNKILIPVYLTKRKQAQRADKIIGMEFDMEPKIPKG
jgi:hypothetical protein